MNNRKIAIFFFAMAFFLVVATSIFALASQGRVLLGKSNASAASASTPVPTYSPIARPSPTFQPVLTVQGSPPHIEARAAYMLDMSSANTLIDINGETPMPMASTTKIMTALIAIQSSDMTQKLTVPQSAYDRVYLEDGSSAGLAVGEKLSLKDLLYAMMLPSGNDAAITIAEGLGGTREKFVARMNLFAYRLRLFQTHFSNPDGLSKPEEDSQHYTTAHDLTLLTQYALNIPSFAEIVQTQKYHVDAGETNGEHDWVNTNKLLADFAGGSGVKTGHTWTSGWCLVFAAKYNGHYLIGVVLDSPNEDQREQDAITLLKWGFALPMLPSKV